VVKLKRILIAVFFCLANSPYLLAMEDEDDEQEQQDKKYRGMLYSTVLSHYSENKKKTAGQGEGSSSKSSKPSEKRDQPESDKIMAEEEETKTEKRNELGSAEKLLLWTLHYLNDEAYKKEMALAIQILSFYDPLKIAKILASARNLAEDAGLSFSAELIRSFVEQYFTSIFLQKPLMNEKQFKTIKGTLQSIINENQFKLLEAEYRKAVFSNHIIPKTTAVKFNAKCY
jgi:hypothetical protein